MSWLMIRKQVTKINPYYRSFVNQKFDVSSSKFLLKVCGSRNRAVFYSVPETCPRKKNFQRRPKSITAVSL